MSQSLFFYRFLSLWTDYPEKKRAAVFCVILFALSFPVEAGSDEIVIDDFSKGLTRIFDEKKFVKQTRYSVVNAEKGKALKAEADGSASLLVYKADYEPSEYPVLAWRWKVSKVLEKGDALKKATDDFPARVYVLFKHWFPPSKKTLCYVWANRLPKGKSAVSGYFKGAMLVAVESGNDNAGKWISEKANIYEDYKKHFGGEPPRVEAIGIMTDTDNTGESAVSWYADIKVTR